MITITVLALIAIALLLGIVLSWALDIGAAILIVALVIGMIVLIFKLIGLPFKLFKKKRKK